MNKNLTGGAIINYGPTLPADGTSYDGAIFYKTAGADQGMYIFGYTADANSALAGDQSTQGWTLAQTPGLYVSKSGDIINGALGVLGGGSTTNDPYGRVSVTLPNDANSYGYYGMTRQGQVGWSLGIDTSNRVFMGVGGSGTMSNVASRIFTFANDGTMQANGNTFWHAGNDGAGSGLDADLLDGQSGAFYQNAGNVNAGTLSVARLPFAPVEQGGTSKVIIGWATSQLNLQVDSTNFGTTWPINISGASSTANFANTATSASSATEATTARFLHQGGAPAGVAMTFNWQGQGGAPTWLWGGSDGVNHYVYSPGALTVLKAASADSVPWTGVTGRPTALSEFTNNAGFITSASVPTKTSQLTNDSGFISGGSIPTAVSQLTNDSGYVTGAQTSSAYLSRAVGVWATSSEGANRFHFASGGTTTYGASFHEFYNSMHVGGAIVADGNITAFSDRRLKTNIAAIPDALAKVSSLTGVTFNRVSDDGRGTGLIAQDVQAVLPEAVEEQPDGMLSLAYGNLVGLLVESIKELSGQVQAMRAEIDTLKNGGQ